MVMAAVKRRRPAVSVRPRVRRGNLDDAQAMRTDLLRAASALFAEGGLDAVSVRAVAARVGVSPMTPYRYFATKTELLGGLVRSVFDATFVQMQAAVAQCTGARERLRASIGAFFGYWEANPDHYRLVFMTEQNTRLDGETAPSQAPIYAEVRADSVGLCTDLARAIGVESTHVRLACDVRRVIALGYLYAMMVNRRYPWSDRQELRTACVEETISAMERCLRHGSSSSPMEGM